MIKVFKAILLKYWHILFLGTITFITYGQTLNMYFWVDDWGMAYKMQHPEANIPNFGPGVAGDGAYRWNVAPFMFLYQFFGLNAFPYFALGLIFYFLTSLSVYFLTLELSRKKLIALISASIFASGYIGSDALNHLNNSYQLVQTGALSALVVWLLIKHYQTDTKKYYLLALIVYTAILEFLFLRSHGLFLLAFSASSLAIVLYKKSPLPVLFKMIPFFSIWVYMFFLDPRMSKNYDGLGRENLLPNTFKLLFEEKHFELFNNLLITISSVVFPDQLLFSLYRFLTLPMETQPHLLLALPFLFAFFLLVFLYIKHKLPLKGLTATILLLSGFFAYLVWSDSQASAVWSPDKAQLFISAWFWSFLVILGSLYFLPKLRKRLHLAYFGLVWVVSNTVIYFVYSPTTNLASNTRYLIPAFMGTAILLGSIFSLLSKKELFLSLVPLLMYCGTLIALTNERAAYIVENISIPAREDLRVIKNTVGSMNDETVFYFEAANESKFRVSELGGIPHFAIPVILNHEGIAKTALSYDEVFYLLKEGLVAPNNVHTFFGKGESITNTTSEFRNLLTSESKVVNLTGWETDTGLNPIFWADLDYPSLTSLELTLEIKVELLEGEIKPQDTTPKKLIDLQEPQNYLKNETERNLFYDETKVTSNSNEKTREAGLVLDGKAFTAWEAGSLDWRQGKRPIELQFELKAKRTIANFTWMNYTQKDTPTVYLLSTSKDGNSWKIVKEVKNGGSKDAGEIIVDSFPADKIRYIKMSMLETYGGKTSAPGIAEAWASQTLPATNLEKREAFDSCILCFAKNQEEAVEIGSLYKNIAKIKVAWLTDKFDSFNTEDYKTVQVVADNNYHTYKIFLPAQGTRIRKVKIESPPYPSEISIRSARIKSLNLKEMIINDQIRNFAD